MQHQQYKMVTLNVNGLRNPIKKSKILLKMEKKLQVIFWQEAHLSALEHEKLKKQNTYYSSHGSGCRRGVAILIPNVVTFEFISEIKDKEVGALF